MFRTFSIYEYLYRPYCNSGDGLLSLTCVPVCVKIVITVILSQSPGHHVSQLFLVTSLIQRTRFGPASYFPNMQFLVFSFWLFLKFLIFISFFLVYWLLSLTLDISVQITFTYHVTAKHQTQVDIKVAQWHGRSNCRNLKSSTVQSP